MVKIDVTFKVTRRAIRPLDEKTPDPPPARAGLVRFLQPDRLVPIDGKVAAEAEEVAGAAGNPLRQSRILYEHVVDTMSYDKTGRGWGRGDALYACDVRRGNCTDFHSLFIGQARSLGIPARFIMGLPLPENKTAGTIPGYHCWGEFYIPEKGWLPIDASEAKKHPDKREQFYGGLDENRIAFSIGRDIKLPEANAESLNYAIYAHVEIDGKTHESVKTTFAFQDVPSE